MNDVVNWDVVAAEIGPKLFRYFCARFSENDADDMTQDTLIRLLRKVELGQFDPKKGSLRMLAFGIAHYVALEKSKELRRHQMQEIEDGMLTQPSAEQELIDQTASQLVKTALNHLSEQEQHIFTLLIDEEMKLEEISLITQSPLGTVKSHIHRAKKKLKELIQKESTQ